MCPDTSPEPHAHIHAHTQHTHTTHEDEDKKIVETVVKTKKNKKGEDFKMEWNCVHSRITHITRTLIHKTYIAHHPRPNLIYVGAFAHACASTSTHHIYIYASKDIHEDGSQIQRERYNVEVEGVKGVHVWQVIVQPGVIVVWGWGWTYTHTKITAHHHTLWKIYMFHVLCVL